MIVQVAKVLANRKLPSLRLFAPLQTSTNDDEQTSDRPEANNENEKEEKIVVDVSVDENKNLFNTILKILK